ncbi:basigin isoform X2 [Gracilinanus agilis]|uniref:basigin isoform X2 n=1 Tax=Gracilinanus agilis TaxID=191870 RepID=UPI001CFDE025|nr:basigin isoform X2 [Gracilinanus agilis]
MGAPLLWLLAAVLLCARAASGTGNNIWTTVDVSGHRTLLTCKLKEAISGPIEGHRWLKGGKVLKEDKSDSLITEYEVVSDDKSGEYQCIFLPELAGRADVQVKGPPKIIINKKSEYGNEGDSIILMCRSSSYPSIEQWKWYKENEMESNILVNDTEGRMTIISTPEKTELHINSADIKEDPGKYICNGTNSEGSGTAVITLKVRSRLAALWPFLGIVAEVLILVIIIFIYEKRRRTDDVGEDEDGGAAPLKSSSVLNEKSSGSIRQRNSN